MPRLGRARFGLAGHGLAWRGKSKQVLRLGEIRAFSFCARAWTARHSPFNRRQGLPFARPKHRRVLRAVSVRLRGKHTFLKEIIMQSKPNCETCQVRRLLEEAQERLENMQAERARHGPAGPATVCTGKNLELIVGPFPAI